MRKMIIQNENTPIVFELNNSPAAKALYVQLPLTLEGGNFSSNEKIFYPPEALISQVLPPFTRRARKALASALPLPPEYLYQINILKIIKIKDSFGL